MQKSYRGTVPTTLEAVKHEMGHANYTIKNTQAYHRYYLENMKNFNAGHAKMIRVEKELKNGKLKMIYSMKILIPILFFFVIGFANAQKLSTKDSVAILFKSKLFTVSEYGIGSKEQILTDIEEQEAVYLETFYKNFVFIKIDFSQPYRNLNQSTSTLNRDCSYYLAFGVLDSRFYRLGGFKVIDIDDFFNDLKLREASLFNGILGNEVEKIDIYCLHEYFELSQKKRKKEEYSCFEDCKKKTETKVIIH